VKDGITASANEQVGKRMSEIVKGHDKDELAKQVCVSFKRIGRSMKTISKV
jgi:hypothetical protein